MRRNTETASHHENARDWRNASFANIPGRAAGDRRLTLIHLRTLCYIGRCGSRQPSVRLVQSEVAEDLGFCRQEIVRALGELADWGYISVTAQGRERRYRLVFDRPCESEDMSGSPDTSAIDLSGPPDTTGDNMSGPPDILTNQSVGSTRHHLSGPPDTPSILEPLEPKKEDSPIPSRRTDDDRSGGRFGSDWFRVLDGAKAPGGAIAKAVELLIAPVVTQRRLDAPVPQQAVTAIARLAVAKGLSEKGLAAAARYLLDTRKVTVKPSDFEAAMSHASVALADKVTVRRGTAQWAAWHRHLSEIKPSWGRLMGDASEWFVDAEWPPAAAVDHRPTDLAGRSP